MVSAAFREGFEAAYIAGLNATTPHQQDQFTLTYVRDDLSKQAWMNSKVRRETNAGLAV